MKEEKQDEEKEGIMPEKEGMMPEKEGINKTSEDKMPSEEDLAKMDREQLLVCIKKMMNKPEIEQKEGSPFMIMMKKQ
jgi:hypothetical protein